MCLNNSESLKVVSGFGYKVVSIEDGKWLPEMMPETFNNKPQAFDRWIRSDGNERFVRYPLGFHVFKSRKAATAWKSGDSTLTVVKVEYRGVLATGHQSWRGKDYPCVVAVDIKVLSPE